MKRSKMILEMERFYNIRHVMLESQYISLNQFMNELLDHLEYKGMLPPTIQKNDGPWDEAYDINKWEPEDEKK